MGLGTGDLGLEARDLVLGADIVAVAGLDPGRSVHGEAVAGDNAYVGIFRTIFQ